MCNESLNSLLNYLNNLGFGSSPLFQNKVEEEVSKKSVDFQIYTEAFFDEYSKTEVRLNICKTEQSELYSLESFDTSVLDLEGKKNKGRSQTFYIRDGLGVTFKESFNLLEGRSVYKNVVS
jgi:hypothetical protein